jgi:hypothetical protein
MEIMDFLEAAFDLCSFGWKVFPCSPGKKEPAIPKREGGRGCLDATDDEEIIGDWARKYPNANIGIACGPGSGIIVVDIDVAGLASVRGLRDAGLKLPPTVSVKTPSGGWHLYYAYAAGPKNSKSLLAHGIDIRTGGGYVVAPPSVLDRSGGASSYRWYTRPLGADLPRLPAWALQKLRPREETPFYREAPRTPGDIEGLIVTMERAPGGERNSILHWCSMRAGEAVIRGEISEEQAFSDMVQAALRVGLSRDESRKTARSGIKRGMRR